jgi:hypothetical protein
MSNINTIKNAINGIDSFRKQIYNDALSEAQKDNLLTFLETLPGDTDYYNVVDAILAWAEQHDCVSLVLDSTDILHRLSRAYTGRCIQFRDEHVKKMAAERFGLNPANPVFQFFNTKTYLVYLADNRVFFIENPHRMSEYYIFDFNVA